MKKRKNLKRCYVCSKRKAFFYNVDNDIILCKACYETIIKGVDLWPSK